MFIMDRRWLQAYLLFLFLSSTHGFVRINLAHSKGLGRRAVAKQFGSMRRSLSTLPFHTSLRKPKHSVMMMKKDGVDISLPERSIAEASLQHLISRRDLMFSASLSAAELAFPRGLGSFPPYPRDRDFRSFVGEYNKAPGRLIVHPETLIEKSPSDQNLYRALTLPNGLRVLLASDPKSHSAAASLNVHVGHYSDPDDLPGLAHFIEHMLFLGNKKYPEEGHLENFLSAHGGSSNALTSGEDTRYFFDVNADSFLPALDIFSQMFVSPLFTVSAMSREIIAIESEHSKNIQADNLRLGQVAADPKDSLETRADSIAATDAGLQAARRRAAPLLQVRHRKPRDAPRRPGGPRRGRAGAALGVPRGALLGQPHDARRVRPRGPRHPPGTDARPRPARREQTLSLRRCNTAFCMHARPCALDVRARKTKGYVAHEYVTYATTGVRDVALCRRTQPGRPASRGRLGRPRRADGRGGGGGGACGGARGRRARDDAAVGAPGVCVCGERGRGRGRGRDCQPSPALGRWLWRAAEVGVRAC